MIRKEVLIITIATFITFLAWVVFDIIHTRAKVDIDPATKQAIEPLDPQFDSEAINLLNK